MGKNRQKLPRQKVQDSGHQTPKSAYLVSGRGYSTCHPSWRFAKLKLFHDTRFGLSKVVELINDILEKLTNFETMNWDEIANQDKDNNHWCEVSGMAKEARDMISQNNLDLDSLFSLRLTGKFRIWGFINQDGSFDIYWCDKEHEIYPSTKKHS